MSQESKVLLVAAARQIYDGRQLYTGDEFEVDSESEAADLIAINFARRAKKKPQEYSREDMRTDRAPERPQPPRANRKERRNRYQNRNLKADP